MLKFNPKLDFMNEVIQLQVNVLACEFAVVQGIEMVPVLNEVKILFIVN